MYFWVTAVRMENACEGEPQTRVGLDNDSMSPQGNHGWGGVKYPMGVNEGPI